MIDQSLLKDMIKVDIVIGGDHSGGKFCMTMKVNFRLPEKKNGVISNPDSKCIVYKR